MIDLTVKIDNEEAKKKFEELRRIARQTTSSIVTDAERMDTAFRAIGKGDNEPLDKVKRKAKKTAEEVVIATKQAEEEIKREVETTTEKINQEQEKRKRKAKKTAEEIQKAYRTTTINIPAFTVKTDTPKTNPLEEIDTTLTHLPDKANAAAGGFNNLNFATQQLVREVPAATMGLHMFFLAISNNLPFFADAIKQVREENKALAASGKPTTSVFKQIISSLFSWQTALVAGITALTLYGKEIGNWVKGLFKGKEALDAIAQAEQTLADVRRQGMLDAQEEVTQVKLAVKAMQDSNRSLDERKRAMRTLQDQYPEYFGKLREEQMLYGEVGESVDALIKRMVALATARKSFDKLVENEQKSTLLKDTKGYQDMMSAAETFTQLGGYKYEMTNSVGQRVKIKEQRKHYNHPKTEEYRALLDAQEAFLDNLKEGGKEAEAIFEEISDKYDGNVGAYIKAIEESNKKLTDEASALITTPDLSEDNAAAEEQKRKAEAALAEAERQAEERKRAIQRLNNDLSEEVQRTQREMDDAEIATIKDGIERKRREIQKGYERRVAEIDKLEADIKKAQGGTLTPEQKGYLTFLRISNTDTLYAGKVLVKSMQDEVAQEATNAMDEYLINYGTFQEKILAITAKYQRLIANAQNEGERKTLEAERDALLAEYEVQASDWANSLVDMTTEQLNKMLEELQAQVEAKEQAFNALGASDSEDAKKYRDEINKLKAQIAVLNDELGKTSRKAGDKNWDESVQTFQEIARAANEAADGIAEFDEDLGNSLRSIAQLASSGLNLVVVIKKITEAAWTGATAIQAMEKASLILAAISAAIQVVSALFNLFRQSDEVEQTKRQFKELNDELVRLHKLARIDSVEGTIFGPNPFGNFINNLKAMQDALKDFEASKEAIRNKDAQYMDVVTGWNADGSAVTQRVPQGRQNLNDAISNMQVMTKHKTWFTDRQYEDLGDLVPDLFDEFGNVTLEGLQNLQNSDVWKNLSKKDRELIEQMIADWEDYNASVEATEKYLSDVFGDLGGDITNALLDSFKSGTDAAEAFGEATGKILDRLASDIVNMALIQPIMDEAQKDVLELQAKLRAGDVSYEEYLKQIQAILDEAVSKAQDRTEDAYDMYEAAGIEENGSSSSSATSKGFQTMSQETGSELNGRFTDIQGQTHRIAEAVEFCKSLHIENLTQVQSINATVAMIHNDTSLIAQHTRVLSNINANLDAIRRSVDDGAI